MAKKHMCGHCGNELAVPQSVESDGKEALARYVAECTQDCRFAEELARNLDDHAFWRWSIAYCDRRDAWLQGDEYEEAYPEGESGQGDDVSIRLYEQTAWTHHFPEWVQTRIHAIMDRCREETINELKRQGAALAVSAKRAPTRGFFQLSPEAEQVLRFFGGVMALAVVVKILQVYSII